MHEYADITGAIRTINNRDIIERKQLSLSMMPPGLERTMGDKELASLLHYLESLK